MKALWIALLLAGCASVPRPAPPLTIEEICPDDETCQPATPEEIREFFRRYE